MIRLRPGWLVVLFAAVIAVSGWLPWRTTTANGGGHSSAIGGWVGYFGPPSKFDAGQLIVLLASGLIVAGAMTARGLSARMSAVAALVLSLSIGGLTVVYYQQKIHPPVDVGVRALHRRGRDGRGGDLLGVGDVLGVVAGARTQMSRFVEPVTLTGSRWVRLEPLTAGHLDEIASAASDGDPGALWFTMAPSPETAGDWVDRMLALQAAAG